MPWMGELAFQNKWPQIFRVVERKSWKIYVRSTKRFSTTHTANACVWFLVRWGFRGVFRKCNEQESLLNPCRRGRKCGLCQEEKMRNMESTCRKFENVEISQMRLKGKLWLCNFSELVSSSRTLSSHLFCGALELRKLMLTVFATNTNRKDVHVQG